ncbi:hypothetical protein Plhal304r1_c049g0131111 [Plasmopara halstedii]
MNGERPFPHEAQSVGLAIMKQLASEMYSFIAALPYLSSKKINILLLALKKVGTLQKCPRDGSQ